MRGGGAVCSSVAPCWCPCLSRLKRVGCAKNSSADHRIREGDNGRLMSISLRRGASTVSHSSELADARVAASRWSLIGTPSSTPPIPRVRDASWRAIGPPPPGVRRYTGRWCGLVSRWQHDCLRGDQNGFCANLCVQTLDRRFHRSVVPKSCGVASDWSPDGTSIAFTRTSDIDGVFGTSILAADVFSRGARDS